MALWQDSLPPCFSNRNMKNEMLQVARANKNTRKMRQFGRSLEP